MKNLTPIVLISIFAVVVVAGCIGQTSDGGIDYSTGGGNSSKGNAYFTMTDAAANMGSVTSVKITFDSLKKVAAELDPTLKDEDVRGMIYEADVNKDGEVSIEEFLRLMRKAKLCWYEFEMIFIDFNILLVNFNLLMINHFK